MYNMKINENVKRACSQPTLNETWEYFKPKQELSCCWDGRATCCTSVFIAVYFV